MEQYTLISTGAALAVNIDCWTVTLITTFKVTDMIGVSPAKMVQQCDI